MLKQVDTKNEWRIVEKSAGPGRVPRTTASIYIHQKSPPKLYIPADWIGDAPAVEYLTNGDRFAIRPALKGYRVTRQTRGTIQLSVPRTIAKTMPQGSTRLDAYGDGDLIVFSPQRAIAAE